MLIFLNYLRTQISIDNVLLDFNGKCKLSDLTSKKEIPSKKRYVDITRVDLIRLGAIIYQMTTGILNVKICKESQNFLVNEELANIPDFTLLDISNDIKEIIQEFLNQELIKIKKSKKLNTEIKKRPFFNGIDWEKLQKNELESTFKPDKVFILI
jgi:hypothetical protein